MPAQAMTLKEQRLLRRLRLEARYAGKDPRKVTLPEWKPPPRTFRFQPSRLSLLPPPHAMDAAALGRAASVAAREPLGSGPALWEAFANRARELLPTLDTQDIALLLNGMARSRHFDHDLVQQLRQCALARVAYSNTRHLAMVLSALVKARLPPADVESFLTELQSRVSEFQGAGEITMTISALSRLRSAGYQIVAQLAPQVETRLAADRFHARDLASILWSYVRLDFLDAAHIDRLALHARGTIGEAAPRELAHLVHASARARAEGADRLVGECVPLVARMVRFMAPRELVDMAIACGHALEASLGGSALAPLLSGVAHEAVRNAAQLEAWQVLVLFQGCVRWRIPLASADLECAARALQERGGELPPGAVERELFALSHLLEAGTLGQHSGGGLVGVSAVREEGREAEEETDVVRITRSAGRTVGARWAAESADEQLPAAARATAAVTTIIGDNSDYQKAP